MTNFEQSLKKKKQKCFILPFIIFCLLPHSAPAPKKTFKKYGSENLFQKRQKGCRIYFLRPKKFLDFVEFIFAFGNKWINIAEFNIAILGKNRKNKFCNNFFRNNLYPQKFMPLRYWSSSGFNNGFKKYEWPSRDGMPTSNGKDIWGIWTIDSNQLEKSFPKNEMKDSIQNYVSNKRQKNYY